MLEDIGIVLKVPIKLLWNHIVIPKKFTVYEVDLQRELSIFPLLFFGDIYILVFVVVVLQLTYHQMCKELPLSPEKCTSRNVSQGEEDQEFGVSRTHLFRRTHGRLWRLERTCRVRFATQGLAAGVLRGPWGPVHGYGPPGTGFGWGRQSRQARLNLFCKSPQANLIAATWSMKQAELLQNVEAVIRRQVIG